MKSNSRMHHDDVIKWKHFPRYWSFVRGLVNSPRKGQWRGALVFSVIDAQINGWVNTGEAGDLRSHHTHYDVIVMYTCNTLFNSFRPGDACIGRWNWSSSALVLVLRLLGQDQCWSNASWIIKTNFSKIESSHKIQLSRKFIWTCSLQNGHHFVQSAICCLVPLLCRHHPATWKRTIHVLWQT